MIEFFFSLSNMYDCLKFSLYDIVHNVNREYID